MSAEKRFLFRVGRMVATPGALEALKMAGEEALTYIMRHQCGDWGELCEEDKKSNEDAVQDGSRILSAYHLSTGVKIWIITEWDRSATTVLLPSDY